MIEEKRNLERKKTGVFFGIYDRVNTKYVGRLVNIHAKGMMVIGKDDIKVNDCFKLKMDLPQEISGKAQIIFDAKCKWCEKGNKSKLFSAGFEFTEVTPENLQLIDDLTDNPIFNDASGISPISVIIESGK